MVGTWTPTGAGNFRPLPALGPIKDTIKQQQQQVQQQQQQQQHAIRSVELRRPAAVQAAPHDSSADALHLLMLCTAETPGQDGLAAGSNTQQQQRQAVAADELLYRQASIPFIGAGGHVNLNRFSTTLPPTTMVGGCATQLGGPGGSGAMHFLPVDDAGGVRKLTAVSSDPPVTINALCVPAAVRVHGTSSPLPFCPRHRLTAVWTCRSASTAGPARRRRSSSRPAARSAGRASTRGQSAGAALQLRSLWRIPTAAVVPMENPYGESLLQLWANTTGVRGRVNGAAGSPRAGPKAGGKKKTISKRQRGSQKLGRWWRKYGYDGPRCATLPQHGLSSNKMALIISDCGIMRSLRIKWP